MQPSEIAAQPASHSLSTSQVLGPHRGVKPFPGSFYHFAVNTNCVNEEIRWKQHIWSGSRERAGWVGDSTNAPGHSGRIPVVHIQYVTFITHAAFNVHYPTATY